MSYERRRPSHLKKPFEVFGISDGELLRWRISGKKFKEVLTSPLTTIHSIQATSNEFGDFTSVMTSRLDGHQRIAMRFNGLGFHKYREHWITNEWYWDQISLPASLASTHLDVDETINNLQEQLEIIRKESRKPCQTYRGRIFEILADMTDEDTALLEMQTLAQVLNPLIARLERLPPTGENLLDPPSRSRLPELYSGEEEGLDALALVKFFTPDSNWTWYASEFNGHDIFFGLVSGFVVELGYFSLKELQEIRGPLGLPIERDLHFEPSRLGGLRDKHNL